MDHRSDLSQRTLMARVHPDLYYRLERYLSRAHHDTGVRRTKAEVIAQAVAELLDRLD